MSSATSVTSSVPSVAGPALSVRSPVSNGQGTYAQTGYQSPIYQSVPTSGYQTITTTSQVAQPEAIVGACGTWTSFLECPLTIFVILAVLFFLFEIFNIWRGSQMAGASSSFWIVSIVALLIYIGIAVAFGYWIKKKCAECQNGQAWLLFFVALFLPVILGIIVAVVVGAVSGGLSFLGTSLQNKGGKGAKGGKGVVATPGGAPIATPANGQGAISQLVDQLQGQVPGTALPASAAAANPLANALNLPMLSA